MGVAPRLIGDRYPGYLFAQAPRNVYWEMTIACDLACVHCRADANPHRDPAELTTEEGRKLFRCVKEMGSMLILTGGDPMKREDLFELVTYAHEIRLPLGITPSTTPSLDRAAVEQFAKLGVAAMGVSMDGPDAATHDGFRQVEGTFDYSMRALEWAREFRIAVQVNTTVTADTMPHLEKLYELLRDNAAPPVRRWSLFVVVPVGRADLVSVPTAEQVEDLFAWVYEIAGRAPFRVGTVEAPHYRRYWIQRKLAEGMGLERIQQMARSMGFGIRDGNGVVFVSHKGEVYPAGFLPEPLLGNVRETPLSQIYRDSPFLGRLRDPQYLVGNCGRCEFRWACGGSRARAYAMTGDPFETDPLCAHVPAGQNA